MSLSLPAIAMKGTFSHPPLRESKHQVINTAPDIHLEMQTLVIQKKEHKQNHEKGLQEETEK